MHLSNEQIAFIEAMLQKQVSYEPLQEELLDHLCCAIERKMKLGASFQTAWQQTFSNYSVEQMRATELETLNLLQSKSFFNMKKIIGLTMLFCLVTVSLLWSKQQQDPPEISPLKINNPRLTSGFGERFHPILKAMKFHKGVDYACPIGTPIVATAAGEVVEVKTRKGYGKTIMIKHDDEYTSLYAQLSEFKVKVGQQVKQGDLIALSGNSGASTAPHLHYEVRKNGKHVDPERYIALEE